MATFFSGRVKINWNKFTLLKPCWSFQIGKLMNEQSYSSSIELQSAVTHLRLFSIQQTLVKYTRQLQLTTSFRFFFFNHISIIYLKEEEKNKPP